MNGLTERWRLDPNSPGSPSRRVRVPPGLLRSAPGEAQCPISFLLRYGDVWTDWRTTSNGDADQEETLDLSTGEGINYISGYSDDTNGTTYSLQAETSAGRQWGPFGDHSAGYGHGGKRLCSSPPTSSGLRLHHLSGDESEVNWIIRWLQL